MCGICGLVRLDGRPASEPTVRTMMHWIKHRGPDDDGVFLEGNVGLGFLRLSIIDLSDAGHQPMLSRDGRYVLVFNGEIFNYIELREELRGKGRTFRTRTDTEVLLEAWQEWGASGLHRLNGMWAFAVFDRMERSLFLARDRYGIKPLYFTLAGSAFAFASEITSLLAILPASPTADRTSVFEFLAYNRTDQSERTFFQEVRRLRHGECLRLEIGGRGPGTLEDVSPKRWYCLSQRVAEAAAFETPSAFRELFTSAVGLRLRSDVPVGVCLSGGLDSSSITSVLLQDYDKRDLNTFSAVYENGAYGDESEFIAEYEGRVRNMFRTTPTAHTLLSDLDDFVRCHAEPVPSTSPYAQYKVMELARGNVVVTLDGQGADELLAGYHYFFGFLFKELISRGKLLRLAREIAAYRRTHRSAYGFKAFSYLMLPEELRERVSVAGRGYLSPELRGTVGKGGVVSGGLYGAPDVKSALLRHFEHKLEHLLKWEDRNSMWFSLEARVPFLDYRLVERVLATPSDQILRNGTTKHLLREALRGRLPEKIRTRADKIGFGTPQEDWFRQPAWSSLVEELLSDPRVAARGVIDPNAARLLHQRHLAGATNASKEIWKWVHLELWYRRFIDRAP